MGALPKVTQLVSGRGGGQNPKSDFPSWAPHTPTSPRLCDLPKAKQQSASYLLALQPNSPLCPPTQTMLLGELCAVNPRETPQTYSIDHTKSATSPETTEKFGDPALTAFFYSATRGCDCSTAEEK